MAVIATGKTLKIKLDTRSINGAIKEIESMIAKLDSIDKEICENLAAIGLKEASVRFASAKYDGKNDSEVHVEATDTGYKVIASGNAVAFIEFGTGVHYNKGASYPIPKPNGIAEIGEYGKKQGRKDEWKYYSNEPGTNGVLHKSSKGKEYVTTHGNPMQMPMYHALVAMRDDAERIVREAFKNA